MLVMSYFWQWHDNVSNEDIWGFSTSQDKKNQRKKRQADDIWVCKEHNYN